MNNNTIEKLKKIYELAEKEVLNRWKTQTDSKGQDQNWKIHAVNQDRKDNRLDTGVMNILATEVTELAEKMISAENVYSTSGINNNTPVVAAKPSVEETASSSTKKTNKNKKSSGIEKKEIKPLEPASPRNITPIVDSSDDDDKKDDDDDDSCCGSGGFCS